MAFCRTPLPSNRADEEMDGEKGGLSEHSEWFRTPRSFPNDMLNLDRGDHVESPGDYVYTTAPETPPRTPGELFARALPSTDSHSQIRLMKVVESLLQAFDVYRSHASDGSSIGTSAATDTGTASTDNDQYNISGYRGPNKRKHSRGKDNGGDDGDDDDNDDGDSGDDPEQNKRRGRVCKQRKEQPRLDCPFFKYNRFAHSDCASKTLVGITRVTQHLKRRHKVPIHCASCFKSFECERDRAKHDRRRSCQPALENPWDGLIDSEKEEEMRKVIKKSAAPTDNWFSLYDCLFPGAERPKSPYPDVVSLGDVNLFWNFVSSEAIHVVEDFLRNETGTDADIPEDSRRNLVKRAMPYCFNRLFERFNGSLGAPGRPAVPFSGTLQNYDGIVPPWDTTAMPYDEYGAIDCQTTVWQNFDDIFVPNMPTPPLSDHSHQNKGFNDDLDFSDHPTEGHGSTYIKFPSGDQECNELSMDH